MIAEKTYTAQQLIDKISSSAAKVNYVDDVTLTAALLHLEQKGLPTNKHEDYKYCNLDAVLKKEFKNIDQKFVAATNLDALKYPGTVTLVVVNGTFSAELSDKKLPKGLLLKPLAELTEDEKKQVGSLVNVDNDAFVALNTAFSSNGYFLSVEKNCAIEQPVHVVYVAAAGAEAFVNTRSLIVLNEQAALTLIEEQVLHSGKVFTNFLSEKIVAQNAALTTYTIQNEGNTGFSINTQQVQVAALARYTNTTVTLSGQVVRNNHNVVLTGEQSEAHLNGLFFSKGQQLVDNHTLVDHQVPNCQSNELYKGVANDKSTGVFNGKIYVRKDAQKTNAYQSSKNILLSDDATINTKPQLEIYANDVKCSHGTSTGKIDEDALFYLNARGIGKETARRMLLASFAQEVIDRIAFEPLHTRITNELESLS